MHGFIKRIYGLFTNDMTIICLFTGIIVYSAYLFYRNNLKAHGGRAFALIVLFTAVFWLVIDMFPEYNVFIFLLFAVSGFGLAAYTGLNRNKLFPEEKEDIDFGALISMVAVLYILLILKTAWLGDDSFITFRTADNFINGYGLTWNVEERVEGGTRTPCGCSRCRRYIS